MWLVCTLIDSQGVVRSVCVPIVPAGGGGRGLVESISAPKPRQAYHAEDGARTGVMANANAAGVLWSLRLPLGPYVHGGSPDSGPVPVRDTPRALPTEAESQIAGRKRRLWVESGGARPVFYPGGQAHRRFIDTGVLWRVGTLNPVPPGRSART